MKKILITGGAGFIGSHLIERLFRDKNCEIVCIDDFNDFYDPAIKRLNIGAFANYDNFCLQEGNICDFGFLEKVFNKTKFEVVIHLAARAGVRPSIEMPLLYEEVNVRGTMNLLECCRRFEVENFIFASSSSVYGNNRKTPFSESDIVDFPVSPYAATKKAGELICYNYHHLYGMNVSCLRFFTVYGPRQRPEMAIHKFTELICEGRPVPMFGDGNSQRDYTFVSDIVNGAVSALERLKGYNIYNLGGSKTIELKKMINLLGTFLKKEPLIEQHPFHVGDVEITYADISKSERELHYKPEVPIEKGLELFVNWYIENKARSLI